MSSFWLAIMAAVIWGFVPLLEKIGLGKIEPLVGLFYRSCGVLIGLVILVLFFLKPAEIRSVDLRSALLVMTGGFLASFVATILFYHALKWGEMSRIVPISGSYPLITFVLGIFLLGESFSLLKLLGVILAVIGVWLLKIG
ncbi:MAG: EamA family transporter [Candidatus Saganbacteria bacterium]|nr:EamA family transporter [Candidatus Saganbacteria bacterium]